MKSITSLFIPKEFGIANANFNTTIPSQPIHTPVAVGK